MVNHFVIRGKLGNYCADFKTQLCPNLSDKTDPYLIVGASFQKFRQEQDFSKKRVLNFQEIFSYVFHYPQLASKYCLRFKEDDEFYFMHMGEKLEINRVDNICEGKEKFVFFKGEEIFA
jgi:hypothetical protein